MPFPSPKLMAVQAVLRAPDVAGHNEQRDERFMAALADEFPRVLTRQRPFENAPPQFPHLTLGSTSSQLAVSLAQVDFSVTFYGELIEDPTKALAYVRKKVIAIHRAFQELDETMSMIGMVATVQFSTEGTSLDPVEHILRTHLRSDAEADDVQDAEAKLALKLRDTYFASLTVKNYEVRQIYTAFNPSFGPITIRPWEGTVTDRGIQVIADINNNLEARNLEVDPAVTDRGIEEVLRILTAVLEVEGTRFAEGAIIDVKGLANES